MAAVERAKGTARERRVFYTGLILVVALGVGVGVPLAATTTLGPVIFLLEVISILALAIWFDRVRRRRP
jgi:cyanate permease